MANRVVFVSPFVARSQHIYDAVMKQAIGRVDRFGQTQTVHVHHFLAARTIGVNILEHRRGKKLVKRGDVYLLVTPEEVRPDDQANFAGAPFEGAACSLGDMTVE